MNNNLDVYLNPKDTPPDIFRAARNNDVAELQAALSEGQSLATQDSTLLMKTPVHVAAAEHSNDFLAAAAHHDSFDPWVRDDNERVAYDHASAFNNKDGMEILFDTMYSDLKRDESLIDYMDNEPSEFYPA